ncbi:MAG: cupredoxin domain-containing protein [Actinomycetota bacterium]
MDDRGDLVKEVRIKVPLPIVIPLGALIVIGGLVVGFSRILLDVPEPVATAIALVMALNVLGAAAFIALRPKMTTNTMLELGLVVLYPMLVGIVLTQTGILGTHAAAASNPAPAAASASGLSITAHNVAFNTSDLTVPAKGGTLSFVNQDSTTHNFAIFKDKSAKDQLFKSPDVGANQTVEIDIPKLDKGSYYFECQYHPTSMNGTLTVK